MNIGVLAYGSLIDDPGEDLAPLIAERRLGVTTPFNVEFAHATAEELARRAILSTSGAAGAAKRDAIQYLIQAKQHGIQTPLMPEYERAILEITGAVDLYHAWEHLRQKAAAASKC